MALLRRSSHDSTNCGPARTLYGSLSRTEGRGFESRRGRYVSARRYGDRLRRGHAPTTAAMTPIPRITSERAAFRRSTAIRSVSSIPTVELHHGGRPSPRRPPLAAAYAANPAPSTTSGIRVVRRIQRIDSRARRRCAPKPSLRRRPCHIHRASSPRGTCPDTAVVVAPTRRWHSRARHFLPALVIGLAVVGCRGARGGNVAGRSTPSTDLASDSHRRWSTPHSRPDHSHPNSLAPIQRPIDFEAP